MGYLIKAAAIASVLLLVGCGGGSSSASHIATQADLDAQERESRKTSVNQIVAQPHVFKYYDATSDEDKSTFSLSVNPDLSFELNLKKGNAKGDLRGVLSRTSQDQNVPDLIYEDQGQKLSIDFLREKKSNSLCARFSYENLNDERLDTLHPRIVCERAADTQ